jgi:hypothetical protein
MTSPGSSQTPLPDIHAMAVPASLTLFGYPPSPAQALVSLRAVGSRAIRAGLYAGGTLVLTPVAALFPPHAPWAVAVLIGGGVLTWRGWSTREVVASFQGDCPRCGSSLTLSPGTRLRDGLAVSCGECGMEPLLKLGDA